jgi:hypothetical protein
MFSYSRTYSRSRFKDYRFLSREDKETAASSLVVARIEYFDLSTGYFLGTREYTQYVGFPATVIGESEFEITEMTHRLTSEHEGVLTAHHRWKK